MHFFLGNRKLVKADEDSAAEGLEGLAAAVDSGMSADDVESSILYGAKRGLFSGGANGGAKLYPYSPLSDNLIDPVISETQSSGFTLINPIAYDQFQLQSSRESYISTLAGHYVSKTPSGCVPSTVRSFMYNGDTIEFKFRYLQGRCSVFVDGELLSQFSLSSGLNSPRYFTLDLGSSKLRRIDVVCLNELWGGISYDPSYSLYKTRDDKLSIGVLGDSFTAGTGSDNLNWVSCLRWKLDSMDIAEFGIGGSGYLNDANGGLFINRIQEIYDAGHEYLMVAGGYNDLSSYTTDEFAVAVDDFYSEAINIGFSSERIIIVSPWAPQTVAIDSKSVEFRDVLRNKADSIGCKFIDSIGDTTSISWFFGSGYTGSETGEGNSDVMISSDGTHPTDEGHLLIGHNVAASLLSAKVKL